VAKREQQQLTEAEMARRRKATCKHTWSKWKDVGRTGDWFKPIIVERRCDKCGAHETEDR
jgi:hypothetical protein